MTHPFIKLRDSKQKTRAYKYIANSEPKSVEWEDLLHFSVTAGIYRALFVLVRQVVASPCSPPPPHQLPHRQPNLPSSITVPWETERLIMKVFITAMTTRSESVFESFHNRFPYVALLSDALIPTLVL
jgi:hypothetical protein